MMLWFRIGSVSTLGATFVFSFGIQWDVFSLFLQKSTQRAMDVDPTYNGTAEIYGFIIMVNMWMSLVSLLGAFIGLKMWMNNYQIDRQLRRLFTIWLSLWSIGCAFLVALAIWGLAKEYEAQHVMPYLYNQFMRMSTDTMFVAMLEKYQRENNCCGIYSSDDWLMVQTRSNMQHGGGGGGGGGSYMDYGYRSNPSTGHCHLTPPTIPMGCGKKILDDVHVKLSSVCAVMIIEAVIGLAAAVLAWYCFIYWLEKETIIIPEDELSNIIIIEPDSSTSGIGADIASNGEYFIPSGGEQYLPIGGSHYYSPGGSQYLPPIFASGRYIDDPVYESRYESVNNTRDPNYFYPGTSASSNRGGLPGSAKKYLKSNRTIAQSQRFASRAGRINSGSNPPNRIPTNASARPHEPSFTNGRDSVYLPTGHTAVNFRQSSLARSLQIQSEVQQPRKHSRNHTLHKQERALGGRVLGEMHVDHQPNDDPLNPNIDVARGGKGHKSRHATLAIIRNKNPRQSKYESLEIMIFSPHLSFNSHQYLPYKAYNIS